MSLKITENRTRIFTGNNPEEVWETSQKFIQNLTGGCTFESASISEEAMQIYGKDYVPFQITREVTYRVSELALALEESK